ncbi:MAG: ABC transporter ATP-binding protein, partial [Inconstantimicrobium porci]|nr:ABC transporter ATP-binding protein [Inconstantimicrobium porci]
AKELREKCRQYIEIIVDDSKKATVLLEEKLGITNYEVINDNMIKVYEKLDETGKINTMLSLNNVEVKKILLKGQNLEEYFVSVVGGAINE